MRKDNLSKFKKHPLDFIKRGFYKTIIGPLKYGRGDDYNAARYWQDRFSKYGLSLKGAGDEGLSEKENKKRYLESAKKLIELLKKEKIEFEKVRVLDIGCGTGFHTHFFYDLGVKNYIGIDITDIFFSQFRKDFPHFKFIKKDITQDEIKGKFDLVIIIDVIEHIVKESKFAFAIENIKKCLSNKGIFIIVPITNMNKKHLFYLRSWSLKDFKQRFSSRYSFRKLIPFWGGYMLIIKKDSF